MLIKHHYTALLTFIFILNIHLFTNRHSYEVIDTFSLSTYFADFINIHPIYAHMNTFLFYLLENHLTYPFIFIARLDMA